MKTLTELLQLRTALIESNRELLKNNPDGLSAEDQEAFDNDVAQIKAYTAQIDNIAVQKENDALIDSANNGDDISQIDGAATIIVGAPVENEDALFAGMADLFNGINAQDPKLIAEAQDRLFEKGFYKGTKFEEIKAAGYSTLTDPEGGIFLPTRISEMIFEYEKMYGFVPTQALELPIPAGREKIPSINNDINFFAVNEGSEIKSRKGIFSGIDLRPLQWGVIVPWTRKIEREAASRLIPVLLRKLAEASARIKDETFFSGDGTSAYHNIKGLAQRVIDGDVNAHVAASGNTTFATLDPRDFLMVQKQIPAGMRSGGVYVMHPDRQFELAELKDDAGNYVPTAVYRVTATGEHFLYGKRVFFTEAAFNEDGTSKNVAAFVNPSFLAYGNGQSMTSERMTEATITDVDDSTEIKLGAQHQAALKVIEEWDLNFGLNEAFAVLQTAAS